MEYDHRSLIGKHNTIGGAPRDVRKFCDDHAPLAFDALLLRGCADPVLLRKAVGLVKTGGMLAINTYGQPLTGGTVLDRMLSAVFERRWWLYFCRDNDVIWTRICRPEGSSTGRWENLPFDHYMDLLQHNVPFSYLRYNDGEWACVLETIYPGPGYQKFTKRLGEDLRISLVDYHRDPHYFMAMPHKEFFRDVLGQWELIAAFLRENDIDDIKWVSAGTFNRASEMGYLRPFIQHLQQHNTVIVGPAKLRPLEKLFPRAAFVDIPETQCHTQLSVIRNHILAQKLPAVILITAGPVCEPLIHKLYEEIGGHSTMIDLGTMWAPYIGKPEHGAHIRMTPEIIARNVGG